MPREVLDRLVFSVGEQDYRWADVVRAAELWSRWGELARETASGLAALQRLAKPIDQSELDEAAQAFRYARSLLAAEEMEAWLKHWGVSHGDWTAYLRRSIARGRGEQPGSEIEAGESDVWAEAVCSGALAKLARELAGRAATADATGDPPGQIEADLGRMDEAFTAFLGAALTPEASAKTIELQGADWVRLEYRELEFVDASMAREAVLCVREDGMSLAEVAQRARVELRERHSLVEEIEPTLSKTLLSAPPGELVGPLPAGDGFLLIQVEEKIAPGLDDPVIQDLLNKEIPRRALEREVRKRVQWHERL